MSRALVDRIADAVLYEGYILYPYRPSVKNRQRWTFGGLLPEEYCRTHPGADSWSNQTECLVHGGPDTLFDARVRFLHLTARTVGECVPPRTEWADDAATPFRPVGTLQIGDRLYHAWQEAEEREVELGALALGEPLAHKRWKPFAFLGGRRLEPLRTATGKIAGVLVREQQTVEGVIEVAAAEVATDLFKVSLRVVNHTPLDEAERARRDDALLRSLLSAHAILRVQQGEFVSLLDPPEPWRDAAAGCRNVGVWPVLAGTEGSTDTMLSSPIILYDYPQLAPESPGDLFDGTEIDEILTLRILALTDEEKREMFAVDERARALLARTEGLAREQLLGLHGTMRGVAPISGEQS